MRNNLVSTSARLALSGILLALTLQSPSVADAQLDTAQIASFRAEDGSYSTLARVTNDLPIEMFYVQGGKNLSLRGRWSGSAACNAPYAITHQIIADTIVIVFHTGRLPRLGTDSLLAGCFDSGYQVAY
jgi:hypothetical protein